METKKLNEVSVAAPYIHSICQASGITHVVDMGSGQGYLSNTLAYLFPSLRVLAIDGSESQIAGSKAFATSLGITRDRIQHLVRYIDGSKTLTSEIDAWAGGQKCLLVGLHACGILSEHMLRYFATCLSITHLAAIGCCYNHIVMRSDSYPDGFPLSERLWKRKVTLSSTALMAGCQAPNNWARTDLTKPKSIYSRRQFYRSMMEKMLHDKGIRIDDKPNWGIRKSDLANFEGFTRRAMESLGVEQNTISKMDISEYETRYASHEGRISILWTLSVICCKAIETVIAIDRYWFLVEHGSRNVDIVPIFDYKISPRNLMMVAEKPHKCSSVDAKE
ncbi:putative c6 transcription factor [Diaporthe ampelina]|uniref:Putative c6 transcription factor n=1 Tax=Diaporthe ampelina TaxID=1214573 RepID=A0A0G2FMS8_9PEZI|nr:putative c6 transcription factor [Diaporthe ampelina]